MLLRNEFQYMSNPLPQIEIIRQIGQGENEIWLAKIEDRDLVVVKTPEPFASKQSLQRLIFEAWFLQHFTDIKNIISLIYFDNVPNAPRLVMPFFSGGNLKDSIKSEDLLLEQRLEMIAIIADAVHNLHQKGFLHSDIKPSNILLDSEKNPFLSDFGFATFFGKMPDLSNIKNNEIESFLLHRLATIIGGTWEYMPPERFDKPPLELLPSSDIYSLGVSLFEVITGVVPYRSKECSIEKKRQILRDLHKTGKYPNIFQLNPLLERFPRVQDVIGNCLSSKPEARYQSAEELAVDIRQLMLGN